MKKITSLLLLLTCYTAAFAQSASSSATQTAKLQLNDAIEISFTATGNATGSVVNMNFNTVNDYANGIESADYQIRVRSNKKFDIEMEASSDYFSYTGTTSPAPQMQVKDVLDMMITANNTGGQINGGYHQFKHIEGDNGKRILNDCNNGANQTFSVKYRATPGFDYPAGTYSTTMIYTATQD